MNMLLCYSVEALTRKVVLEVKHFAPWRLKLYLIKYLSAKSAFKFYLYLLSSRVKLKPLIKFD